MIAAIVPAAGLSRRMGTEKQLLPFHGTTVLGHVVDELLRSRVDEVYVVLGHAADRVRQSLASRPVHIVENPDYANTDMLASVRRGLEAAPADCRAMLIALGDQPSITAEVINTLLAAHATGKCGIVVPIYDGRRGHPLLISNCCRDEILTQHDRVGLRGLLAAHPADVLEVSVASPTVLSDMNYPEDYERELKRGDECRAP